MTSAKEQSPRDYHAAVQALNTLQSNFAIVDAIRKSGRGMNKNAIPEMIDWCRRSGYEPSDFDCIDAIHIAGTKGKGSTSAFISSILTQYQVGQHGRDTASRVNGASPKISQVGLYTSPHLRSVCERISINNKPISEAQFAHFFWFVWDKLEAYAEAHGPQSLPPPAGMAPLPEIETQPKPTKPVYFRYLTLMAMHAYRELGVRPAVIECGIGGEYDSTNILTSPSVCAVTSLGIDHTAVLGESIEEIAWHKAGIFKTGSKTSEVYTVASQPEAAMNNLEQRAQEKGKTLIKVQRHHIIESGHDRFGRALKLGLSADFQKTNASLAVAVAAAHLHSRGITTSPSGVPVPQPGDPDSELPPEFTKGLETVRWGGRCEVRQQGRIRWCLDGGHTVESLKLAGEWFGGVLNDSPITGKKGKKQKRILLFNQQTRDAVGLAKILYTALRSTVPSSLALSSTRTEHQPLFDYAHFSTNITFSPTSNGQGGTYKPDLMSMNTSTSEVEKLTVQRGLAQCWRTLDKGCGVAVCGSIEDAVARIRELEVELEDEEEIVCLVTGSLHLVGGALEVLETL